MGGEVDAKKFSDIYAKYIEDAPDKFISVKKFMRKLKNRWLCPIYDEDSNGVSHIPET